MKDKTIFLILIVFISCLSAFASDIYAPAIPDVATSLKVHISHVQFSLAIYMAGVTVSMLVAGILSEGIGRRPLLISGLLLMLIGTFMCIHATHIELLIFGRLVQGIGAGASSGLWRTIFRDRFSGTDLAKYSAYLTIFVVLIIPAAPMFGGYIQHFLGWRFIFVFISFYILITVIMVALFFKESHQHIHVEKLRLSFIKTNLKHVLSHRIFIGVTVPILILYGSFFSWYTVGPVLLIKQIGISPIYFGWLNFICAASTFTLGGFIGGRLVEKVGALNMLRLGLGIVIVGGLLMITLKFILGLQLWAIYAPAVLIYFGFSFVWPNAFSIALTPLGTIAGYGGSLYGVMQIAGAAILGSFSAYLPHETQLPLAIVFTVGPIISLAIFEWLAVPLIKAQQNSNA